MENVQIDDARLELAVQAAKKAGSQAESVKQTTHTERKDNNSIVTEADRDAESIVRDVLTAYSDHPILGEEHGGNTDSSDTYWVIDPIDGTRNFAYKQPFYGCAVALVEDGEPAIGVWYMPEMDYLFYGVNGKGAYHGSQKISVMDNSDMGQLYSLISGKEKEKVRQFITPVSESVQSLGSAVMGSSWIASGWNDVGVFGALAPWDMAVGVVLVRESGGVVKSVSGGKSNWGAISEGRVVLGKKPMVDSLIEFFTEDEIKAFQSMTYDW